jgi:hypothetical protein
LGLGRRGILSVVLLPAKEGKSVADVLVEVHLILHEFDQVHRVLIDDHAGDLGGEGLSEDAVDSGVDRISDHLSAAGSVWQGAEHLHVKLGQRDVKNGGGWRRGHWGHGLINHLVGQGGKRGHLVTLLLLTGLVLLLTVLLLALVVALLELALLAWGALVVTATLTAVVAATTTVTAALVVVATVSALIVVRATVTALVELLLLVSATLSERGEGLLIRVGPVLLLLAIVVGILVIVGLLLVI